MLFTHTMLRDSILTSLIFWEENLYAKLDDWELVNSPVASVCFKDELAKLRQHLIYRKSKRHFENVTGQGTLELWCKNYY